MHLVVYQGRCCLSTPTPGDGTSLLADLSSSSGLVNVPTARRRFYNSQYAFLFISCPFVCCPG